MHALFDEWIKLAAHLGENCVAQRRVIAGAAADQGLAFLDVDDTIREVHGYSKQGAGYGYTRVRGLNIQIAALSTPLAGPVIARARLRKGNTGSARGAGRMVAQAVTTARAAGVRGRILCRADSAYYGWAFVGAALRANAWFSVTARMTKTVTRAIAGLAEDAKRQAKKDARAKAKGKGSGVREPAPDSDAD